MNVLGSVGSPPSNQDSGQSEPQRPDRGEQLRYGMSSSLREPTLGARRPLLRRINCRNWRFVLGNENSALLNWGLNYGLRDSSLCRAGGSAVTRAASAAGLAWFTASCSRSDFGYTNSQPDYPRDNTKYGSLPESPRAAPPG